MPCDDIALRVVQWQFYSELAVGIAAVVTLLACWLLWRYGGRLSAKGGARRQRLAALHRDQGALASLEFLLVLMPLMAVVLAVWQVALMINAQMNVSYAAYTAARSASVVAFMDLPNEDEGALVADGEKWQKINRAALPALIAISPGGWQQAMGARSSAEVDNAQDSDFSPSLPGTSDALALIPQVTVLTLHRGGAVLTSGSRTTRAGVKALYAGLASNVSINGSDRDDAINVSNDETLTVSVEYDFWLNVPYAGRMMKAAFDNAGFQFSSLIGYPTLRLSESVVVRTWPKQKAF